MRAVAAVLVLLLAVLLLAVLPASAQSDISPTGTTAKPPAQPANDAATGREGATRLAAAAARKRAPTPPGPVRDTATPLADRLALQFDLAWSGDYNGLVNGEINDKTTAAIKTFQHDRKFKETGVLNTQERALLAALAKAKQAQVGWSVVDDPARVHASGFRPSRSPKRARPRTGLAGLRRKDRSKSRPSRSGSPARRLRRCTSNRRKNRRPASSRSTSCAPISSSCRACRT